MPPFAIFGVLVAALLSGPTAFLLMWLTYRKTGEASLRSIALSLLGLSLILIGNGAAFVLDNFLGFREQRVAFLLMNAVFLATVMTGGFILRFAHEATGTGIRSVHRSSFWIFTTLFFFLVISLPIFMVPRGAIDVGGGYLSATVYGTLCETYAAILVIRRRRALPELYRSVMPKIFIALPLLGALSIANDVVRFGSVLGWPDFPFSPLFMLLMNSVVVVFCVKALLKSGQSPFFGNGTADFGFSDREREIAPLIADGLTNDEIAERLCISPHTVKNHVTSIFRKAEVSNRLELLKRLSRNG